MGPNQTASVAADLTQSIHRLSRRLRKRSDVPLTASQMSVLMTVERRGELRLGELARLEQISKSTMTRLVAKLVEAGFLLRQPDPEDGRGSLVSLTADGVQTLKSSATRQQEFLGRLLDALSEDERTVLSAAAPALEKLLSVKV